MVSKSNLTHEEQETVRKSNRTLYDYHGEWANYYDRKKPLSVSRLDLFLLQANAAVDRRLARGSCGRIEKQNCFRSPRQKIQKNK